MPAKTPHSLGPADFTIVVPARNEAQHIGEMLARLSEVVSKAQLVVVDDHSTDNTASLVRAQGVHLLQLPPGTAGKKAALTAGIDYASTPWICTLDADVMVSKTWLEAIGDFTADNVAVVGPVMLSHSSKWFERWQSLDFCGMMVITAASLQQGKFAMGNGANLAFAKTAWQEVGGYESPDTKELASGDDMVLLDKLTTHFPGQVAFAKTEHAVVTTPAKSKLIDFVSQRLRWSAKTGLNHQPILTLTLAAVWAFHVGLLLALPFAYWELISWQVVVIAWLCKLLCDFLLLREATNFFTRAALLNFSYPLGSVVHTIYVAGIGLLALLPIEFEWKGRVHKH